MSGNELNDFEVSRRRVLYGLSGALGVLATGAAFPSLAQSGATVSTLMLATTASDGLRSTLEQASKFKIENGAFINTIDTVARLMAPNSAGRFDVMIAQSEVARPAVMGQKAGEERTMALDLKFCQSRDQRDAFRRGAGQGAWHAMRLGAV